MTVCGKTFEFANGHVTTACQLPQKHAGDCRGTILGSPTRWDGLYATEEEAHFDHPSYDALHDEVNLCRAELATVTAERDELVDELSREKRDADNLRSALEDVRSERITLRAECDKRGILWNNAQAERNDLRDELATVTAERDALSVRVATAERDRFDLLAERDALRATLTQAQETGNVIMEAAFGKPAPLSDSELCWLITELRAQAAALRAKVDAVPVDAIRQYWGASEPSIRWHATSAGRSACEAIRIWLGTLDA